MSHVTQIILGAPALDAMRRKMLADEIGREILAQKPVVTEHVRIHELRLLPAGVCAC